MKSTSHRKRRRKESAPPIRVTLNLARALESLLTECRKEDGSTNKAFLDNVLGYADEIEESDAKLWREAFRWTAARPPSNRGTRYISPNTLELTTNVCKHFGCSRDAAFNAICTIGLEGYLAILREDFELAKQALIGIERIEASDSFEDLLYCLSIVDIDRDTQLKTVFEKMKKRLKKQVGAKQKVLTHAQTRKDALPLFIARVVA